MAYKVVFNMDDGSTEELEEEFDSIEEADEAAAQAASDYAQGRDYLEEAGRPYCEEEVIDWEFHEV